MLFLATLVCISNAFAKRFGEDKDSVFSPFPYVFLIEKGELLPPEFTDEEFYANAKGVVFPVNKFHIPQDNTWLRELKEKVEPWASARGYELRRIMMRGASSPEGPVQWNNTLAENRSKALRDTLRTIFHVGYDLIDPNVVQNPEDYKALLFAMRDAQDPDTQIVENILEKHHWDRVLVKRDLKAAKGGRLWNRLLQVYFPGIRYARVCLFFQQKIEWQIRDSLKVKPIEMMKIEWPKVDIDPDAIPFYMPEPVFTPELTPRRRMLALRSNLVYDALYMPGHGWAPSPNIAMEYFPSKGRFTYNAELTYPDWEEWPNPQKFWQIHDYQLGVRCYTRRHKVAPGDAGEFSDMAADYFQGFFVGAYLHAGRYGIGFNKKKGWEGEYAGGGLQLGYTLPLCKSHRWRMEFTASAGAIITKYDPYVYGNPVSGEEDGFYYYNWLHSADLFIKRNHRITWFGPTGFGIHLTYDLLYHRNAKKGASFKRWEKGGAQ